jgi:hypothetical protein
MDAKSALKITRMNKDRTQDQLDEIKLREFNTFIDVIIPIRAESGYYWANLPPIFHPPHIDGLKDDKYIKWLKYLGYFVGAVPQHGLVVSWKQQPRKIKPKVFEK